MSKLSRAEKKALKKKQNQLEVKDTCINCEQFIALDQRFCSHCGGKRIYNKLTWRNLLEDFFDRFFNLENSFVKTFVALFRQPEDVIGGYINGMRKKYLPAFSYFAIAITFTSFYYYLLKGWFWDNYMTAQKLVNDESISQTQLELQESISTLLMENQSLYMFLIIPFFALMSKIVFWNYKKYNLVEHFVIYLYVYSHFSMISVVMQIAFIWSPTVLNILSVVVFLLMLFYTVYVLKRLFKLTMTSVLVKTLFFFLIFTVFSCVLSLPLVALSFKSAINVNQNGQKEIDDSNFIGKILKFSQEQAEQKIKQDSIKQDSLKRLEYELEITPDMIKNRPQ
ncbi:hypothetical protein DCS32_11370 [Dokdonia sp. Dokd-P16]|uniref:DUF3667 domain-containing protein n=1 Tax=Dokdonia sp. Dokd-P16 TaxID=2173169 RepID=UPI000D548608|nr:DUF3667 domain-containing protein [Dokdonia sp. Dokd-P16]AWH74734.1 hypothetical protein DCS32_11370 [Dokdonia sp. Dokd-P16]